MNKGILKQVSGNVVNIDNLWLDASKVIQFLPNKTGIEVEFDYDQSNMSLKFIRLASNSNKSYSKSKKSYSGRTTYRKNSATPTNKSNSTTVDKRTDSIVKQVIFKAAIEEHKLYPDKNLIDIYEELLDTFYNELV